MIMCEKPNTVSTTLLIPDMTYPLKQKFTRQKYKTLIIAKQRCLVDTVCVRIVL